jgi:phage tail sheath protein FI
MAYLHGTYGVIGDSKVDDAIQSSTVAVYFGTAPVNLIRDYADAGIINSPVKVANMQDVQSRMGYAADWDTFTLCEAFAEHFNNTVGNVGPIYVINVLNPDVHKKTDSTSRTLTFSNGRAEFESTTVILDTFAIADKAEGVDYTLSYNYGKATVVITAITELTGDVACTYGEIDASTITSADIIGQAGSDGSYTGIAALQLLYQYENAVANILCAPGWSHIPEVYTALVSAAQKINGHWDAFVVADIPLEITSGSATTAIDTIDKAIQWKADNGYTSEFSKVCWPQVKDGSGNIYRLSTVCTATMLRVDLSHDSVPFESPSNKTIMATGQYFGASSANKGFDQQTGNKLNEKGITTAAFWSGQWVLWGPHTAAYTYGGDMDARSIFDVNIRMLEYITNRFQLDHGTKIDGPLSPQDKDSIINFEQAKLDALGSLGALIGTPTVEFLETANPISNLINGDFVWDISATNTPPFKSGTARVSYTDDGFAAFFGGE